MKKIFLASNKEKEFNIDVFNGELFSVSFMKHEDWIIYEVNITCDDISAFENNLRKKSFVKYFEDMWVFLEKNSFLPEKLISHIFSFFSEKYDAIIDRNKNISCYEFLFDLGFFEKRNSSCRILDFGCGTGLITQTSFFNKFKDVYGFDISEKMRFLSKKKGLVVYESISFYEDQKNSFDLILANYVFHFNLSADIILKLCTLLTGGGVMLGNFHKNINFDIMINNISCLAKKGFEVSSQDSDFGRILIVKRLGD